MTPRTEHILALVSDGATLEEAGEPFGLSRERVRQILAEEGINIRKIPGVAAKRAERRFAPVREAFGDEVERLWGEGLSVSKIAVEIGISRRSVERLVGERTTRLERIERVAAAQSEVQRRWSDDDLLALLRVAAQKLGKTPGANTYTALRDDGLFDGPDYLTFVHRFSTWNNAVAAAGLVPNARPSSEKVGARKFSDGDIRAALVRVAGVVGHTPSMGEYDAQYVPGEEPGSAAIRARWGSWIAARRAVEDANVVGTPTKE